MTRAPCRKRAGEAVPRAEFGDLTTADHKVLNEGGESRNNHRCAVVVQDLATQYPKRKLLRRRKGVHERQKWSEEETGNKEMLTIALYETNREFESQRIWSSTRRLNGPIRLKGKRSVYFER